MLQEVFLSSLSTVPRNLSQKQYTGGQIRNMHKCSIIWRGNEGGRGAKHAHIPEIYHISMYVQTP
jgi:hypothetical protein